MSRPTSVQATLGPMELKRIQTGSDTSLDSLQTWKDIVVAALARSHVSGKGAAAEMQISEQQFSSQLAYDGSREHRDHLSFWRMRSLPPAFWRELILLILDFHKIAIGQTSQQDADDAAVGRLVREVVTRCSR